MMLAGELALAGIDVVVVERRASQAIDGSRGGGLHSRTIEVLDQRGIAERFLAEGQQYPVGVPILRGREVAGFFQDDTRGRDGREAGGRHAP